ncbi:unnamed protein product [Ectocarpus sp. CCAP 1310/34]|nr:unnamed protein product [Ectocarpus sp. CCAP 1310/34]
MPVADSAALWRKPIRRHSSKGVLFTKDEEGQGRGWKQHQQQQQHQHSSSRQRAST